MYKILKDVSLWNIYFFLLKINNKALKCVMCAISMLCLPLNSVLAAFYEIILGISNALASYYCFSISLVG